LTISTTKADAVPFPQEETWNYIVRYKYGLVVMKAGNAHYRLNTLIYNNQPAVKSSLYFKTNSFFDKIFFIRDTLKAYASLPDYEPLYHTRSVNEGHTHFTEETGTRKFGEDYTEWQIKQIRKGEVRIDTILSVYNQGYDLLNIFLYVRQLDYASLRSGDSRKITTVLGNKKTNLIIRYAGPTTVERSDKRIQNAFFLSADIADEVFSEAKNAMEIWISDDEYHIPLRMKAKLKIGAAEAELM
jgi:hypothetical protein